MFITTTFTAVEADAHRRDLITEAENHRIAWVLRAARRDRRAQRRRASRAG